MVYYAQLDSEGIVIGVSELASVIENDFLVRIDELDTNLIKKYMYNKEKQRFEEIIKTREELLQELKTQYLSLINDAVLLGDDTEKERLQQEYQQKKTKIESEQ